MNTMTSVDHWFTETRTSRQQIRFISALTFQLILVFAFMPLLSWARSGDPYDEVSVSLTVKDIGSTEIPALIEGKNVYLSISDVLGFLKIVNTSSPGLDSVSGFFIRADSAFLFDKTRDLIRYKSITHLLKAGDMILTKSSLYLRSDYFGQLFGLNCVFNFRNLTVVLTTKVELPVLRELRQEAMRENIRHLKGTQKADTNIRHSMEVFHPGMADWSLYAVKNLGSASSIRANLGLGAVIAGGETNLVLTYANNEKFKEREQFYSWRYADNDNKGARQITLGKINSGAISSIFAPVLGAQVTNMPTVARRSFDGYRYSGFTEPNWVVELYVNTELVDYKKADPSGFFVFDVPLVYGNSSVKLRFYGPYGEERTKELTIEIPFNFMPVNEFEYTATAGIVEDSMHSKFARLAMNYGLNSRITIGGGVEYLSSILSGSTMPFANFSARIAPGLLFTGDYTYGVRSRAILDYRLPMNLQMEASYTRYVPGQRAINLNYLEDRKISLSLPIHLHSYSLFTRFSYDNISLPGAHYTNTDWLLTFAGKYFTTNITTYAILFSATAPYIYSNYSITLRLPKGIMFTPQVQYEYRRQDLISMRGDLEKKMFRHGFMNITFDRNFKAGLSSFLLGLRYEFGISVLGTNIRSTNNVIALEQAATGSVIYEAKEPLVFANRSNVGRGGLRLYCYLDMNGNGRRDQNEPKVSGLTINLNGGQIKYDKKDTSVIVYQLEPFMKYTIQLNQDNFQNIAWSMTIHSLNVSAEPDQIRLIELPVSVRSEASGRVISMINGEMVGQDRLVINFVNSKGRIIARTLTDVEGTFTYMGLAPGQYRVELDSLQLNRLKLTGTPAFIPVTIHISADGEIIENLLLEVKARAKTKLPETKAVKKAAPAR